jgi:hypothetical protein
MPQVGLFWPEVVRLLATTRTRSPGFNPTSDREKYSREHISSGPISSYTFPRQRDRAQVEVLLQPERSRAIEMMLFQEGGNLCNSCFVDCSS